MNILVLPGDDIGPEITAAALAVLERANSVYSLGLTFVQREVGVESYRRVGTKTTAVAANFPNVPWHEMDIDAMAADLYTRPERHDDILITTG